MTQYFCNHSKIFVPSPSPPQVIPLPTPPITPTETLEEFHTSVNQQIDQQAHKDANQPLKAKVGKGIVDAGSNAIVTGDMVTVAVGVVKQVPGGNDVLKKMLDLASQVAEIGKVVPFIAPAFEILKVRELKNSKCALDHFRSFHFLNIDFVAC